MRLVKAEELDDSFYEYKDPGHLVGIREVVKGVKEGGDDALRRYTKEFDKIDVTDLRVDEKEVRAAYSKVDDDIVSALKAAAANIEKFSKMQMSQFKDIEMEITRGVVVGQRVAPIQRVGIYVPGGRYPLVSTLLMCAVPARVAGVMELVLCSPPTHEGSVHPAILAAADIVGVDEIYRVGGAQAIAAMAYGTATIRSVDKIVGPGNRFVAWAKKEVFGKVGIDIVAGPTEVMIIADGDARPELIAADLLAQAEHDPDAQPVLVTDSKELARKVSDEVDAQLKELPTADVASRSIEQNGLMILVWEIKDAIDIANRKAPEHIELMVKDAGKYVPMLTSYGSLFIGENTAEALGDYSSGLNHTLPTNMAARYTSGLSVRDFVRLQTTLKVSEEGLKDIGPIAKRLAETEGLKGHARSVEKRMKGK